MMLTSWKVRSAALAVRDALVMISYPSTSLVVLWAPSPTLELVLYRFQDWRRCNELGVKLKWKMLNVKIP